MRYKEGVRQSQKKHWLLFAVILLVAGGAFAAIYTLLASPTEPKAVIAKQTKPADPLTSRIMFVGDVFWGRQVQRKAESSPKGYEYLTSGLNLADRQAYDAWVGNFECPVTTRDIPYSVQVDRLAFNCRPEYLPTLAKYFTAASLANNHTDNNGGMWGLEQSRQQLAQNNIQAFGTYRMSDTEDICEVVSIPARSGERTTVLPVALCGYMYVVNATPANEQLAVMRQYAAVMPVIALPHMGVEYRDTAEAPKEGAYRRMIDNGADMVIGAHPHVIQNSESYKGKLIAYSLGNFMFDQQSVSPATNLALAVGISLTVEPGKGIDAYNRVGSDCKQFKDDCLSRLQQAVKTRPAMTLKYEFDCYSLTSGVPVKGTSTQCEAAKKTATTDNLNDLSVRW
ncbi:MAG TPA: CapA family protein [Candidatus Saccharimonadales bacterium]